MATIPIEQLLTEAAAERVDGVVQIHSHRDGFIYLVEGEVYFAELTIQPPLSERLVQAGLLTPEQVARHTEPGDDDVYLALALDTDDTIDEAAIGAFLLDATVEVLGVFMDATQGEYELDPYGSHSAGVLVSWPPADVFERVRQRRAEVAAAEAASADASAPRESVPGASPESAASGGDDDVIIVADPNPPGTLSGSGEPGGGDTRVVTRAEAPEQLGPILLEPVEWRVVVLAAPGISTAELADRMNLDTGTVRRVVATLCERGLLETVN